MTETPNPLDIAAELEGFAEGSTSARASLMRDAAAVIRSLVPQTPTDDEREALGRFIDKKLNGVYGDGIGEFLSDHITDSDLWRSRHHLPTEVEYAARWAHPTHPFVTDFGASLEDLRALAEDQKEYKVEVVSRVVSGWEVVE